VLDDVVFLDKPVIFAASKDRPILFTALAWSTVLLTLDRADFADLLGGQFYGLDALLPYDLLQRERDAGRLSEPTNPSKTPAKTVPDDVTVAQFEAAQDAAHKAAVACGAILQAQLSR